jgi:hypothetical protein
MDDRERIPMTVGHIFKILERGDYSVASLGQYRDEQGLNLQTPLWTGTAGMELREHFAKPKNKGERDLDLCLDNWERSLRECVGTVRGVKPTNLADLLFAIRSLTPDGATALLDHLHDCSLHGQNVLREPDVRYALEEFIKLPRNAEDPSAYLAWHLAVEALPQT